MKRAGRQLEAGGKFGRRRKACDHCAQKKKACDEVKPCLTCQLDGVSCTSERLSSVEASKFGDEVDMSCIPSNGSGLEKIPINFLLNFTSPGNETRPDFSRAVDAAASLPEDPVLTDPYHSGYVPELWPDAEAWFATDPGFSTLFSFNPWFDDGSGLESSGFGGNVTLPVASSSLLLEKRAGEIREQILGFHTRRGRFPSESATDMTELLEKTFTAVNIHDATEDFFSRFHIHFPIIHKPTFCLQNVSLYLLLAVFQIGAIQLAPKDLYYSAEECVDIVEDYIFDAEEFKLLSNGDLSLMEAQPSQTLEVLQAASLMIALGATGTSQKLRQMRSRRFPLLVLAIRTLGLTSTTNNYHAASGPPADVWRAFVASETRIR